MKNNLKMKNKTFVQDIQNCSSVALHVCTHKVPIRSSKTVTVAQKGYLSHRLLITLIRAFVIVNKEHEAGELHLRQVASDDQG
jgi:hypothetical protein